MRIRPILFNTDMVRAILDGRKTTTRRALKYPFEVHPNGFITKPRGHDRLCPYEPPYQQGDILYVRETYRPLSDHPNAGFDYAANWSPKYFKNSKDPRSCNKGKWKPSIHMPKRAARIWLKVVDVRVERLCNMKLDDFLDEGVCIRPEAFNDPENAYMQARNEFVEIWDSTISKGQQDLYSWGANPWTWVIEFERCEKPETAGEENHNGKNDKK